jgi:aspartate/glutamate racemase
MITPLSQTPRFGIISGAGPMAGALLYTHIITLCQKRGAWQDCDFPDILLRNVPFSPMLGGQKHQPVVKNQLHQALKSLKNHVDYIYIACQTLHGFLSLEDMERFKVVSLLDIIQQATHLEKRPVSIIASQTSCAMGLHLPFLPKGSSYIEQERSSYAIETILKGHRPDMHWVEDMAKETPLLLGCTEFSVALKACENPLIIDPLKEAADNAVERFHSTFSSESKDIV